MGSDEARDGDGEPSGEAVEGGVGVEAGGDGDDGEGCLEVVVFVGALPGEGDAGAGVVIGEGCAERLGTSFSFNWNIQGGSGGIGVIDSIDDGEGLCWPAVCIY